MARWHGHPAVTRPSGAPTGRGGRTGRGPGRRRPAGRRRAAHDSTRDRAADPDVVEAARWPVGVHRRRRSGRTARSRRARAPFASRVRRAEAGGAHPGVGRLVRLGVEVADDDRGVAPRARPPASRRGAGACSSRAASSAVTWWRWVDDHEDARAAGEDDPAPDRRPGQPEIEPLGVGGGERLPDEQRVAVLRPAGPAPGRFVAARRRPPRSGDPAGGRRRPPGGRGGRAGARPCRRGSAAGARPSDRRGCGCSGSRRGGGPSRSVPDRLGAAVDAARRRPSAGGQPIAGTAADDGATGRWTVNVEPRPSSDSTQIRPPCCSITWRAIASPRPVPPPRTRDPVDLVEPLEDPGLVRRRDADPVVLDGRTTSSPSPGRDPDLGRSSVATRSSPSPAADPRPARTSGRCGRGSRRPGRDAPRRRGPAAGRPRHRRPAAAPADRRTGGAARAASVATRPRSTSSRRTSGPPPSIRARSSSSLTIWTRWPVSTSIFAIRSRIRGGTAVARRLGVAGQRLGEQADRRERRPQLVRQVVDELGPDLLEAAQLRHVLEDDPDAADRRAPGADDEDRPVRAAQPELARRRARRPGQPRSAPRPGRRGTSRSPSGREASPAGGGGGCGRRHSRARPGRRRRAGRCRRP